MRFYYIYMGGKLLTKNRTWTLKLNRAWAIPGEGTAYEICSYFPGARVFYLELKPCY